jgi:hypothetical protein
MLVIHVWEFAITSVAASMRAFGPQPDELDAAASLVDDRVRDATLDDGALELAPAAGADDAHPEDDDAFIPGAACSASSSLGV